MKKTCSNPNCIHKGEKQDVNNFFKRAGYARGENAECKDCSRARQKQHNAKRAKSKEDFFNMYM